MGKNNKTGLGRALIKNRFASHKGKKTVANNTMLHTTEVQDGYEWGRLNLQSVTEESSFQEFLSTAELAGTEFQAEKLNVTFVRTQNSAGLLSDNEKKKALEEQEKNKSLLKIPRRPKWNAETTPEQLQQQERDDFLNWRRQLSMLQEDDGLLLTPYEKNLEYWRQLWRVVERSDVVVQIVDARNPLLFRCEDLEKYIEEISPHKINLILCNKADFLTEEQRSAWAAYFSKEGIRIAFFSAKLAAESAENNLEDIQEVAENGDSSEAESENIDSNESSALKCTSDNKDIDLSPESYDLSQVDVAQLSTLVNNLSAVVCKTEEKLHNIQEAIDKAISEQNSSNSGDNQYTLNSEIISFNSNELQTRDSFINLLQNIHKGTKVTKDITTIGLVGYPNVGKSSTINALLTVKKVSVSTTPGKTKHFQTIYLNEEILLCDCPGLVMPSFVLTKAEMIINGILPIDQIRDHVPPINLVCSLIPRHILEDTYGIIIAKPDEGEDQDRCPNSEEFLNSYGFNRGFMTANGQPDCSRAARYILKDYVTGKLLYCMAPPEQDQNTYHPFPKRTEMPTRVLPPRTQRAQKIGKMNTAELDRQFFMNNSNACGTKGVAGKPSGLPSVSNTSGTASTVGSTQSLLIDDKPWKKLNKHANKKKKEKLRRVYSHLDEH